MFQSNINIKTGGNGEYFYLDYYIPKNKKNALDKCKLTQSIKYSDLILKYKKGDSRAIAFYIKILNNIIYNYFYFYDLILPVPPSNSFLDVYPNSQVCLYLSAMGTISTYEKAVVCTKGHRPGHIENNIELKKMDSDNISFEHRYDYKSKKIIIFDDIITTGTTFKLLKNALLKEGASAVTGIFLGKTATEADIINFAGGDI
jgi:ATP-dependent DNA helicase RecQ